MDKNSENIKEKIVEISEKGPSKNIRIYCLFKTCMLVLPFVAMGITHSIQYTTIPDMRTRLNTTAQGLSYSMAVGALGGIFGGPMSGLADKFTSHADLVISGALLAVGSTYSCFPYSPELWILGCLDFVFTMGWALYQGAAHSVISVMWGPDGGSARHAIHFGYPIGSVLGPLIAMPFLSTETNDTEVQQNYYDIFPSFYMEIFEEEDGYRRDFADDSRIEIAYLISGTIVLTLMLLFTFMYFFGPKNATLVEQPLEKESRSWKEVVSPSTWAEGDFKFGLTIATLAMLYFFLVLGAIKGTQEYLVTYAVDSELFTNQEAATLNSVTFAMGTLARGIAIVAVRYINITHMCVIETHGLFLFATLCILFGTESKTALWILAPCLGFFREALWPSGYAWTDNFIILFGVLVGLIDVMIGVTNFVLVAFQGYLYTNTVIESIFYTTAAYGLVLCVLIHIMNFIGRRHGQRKAVADTIVIDVKENQSTYL